MVQKRIRNELSSSNADGGRKAKEPKLIKKSKLHTVKWSREKHLK
jgi:hypothetical protein